MRASLLLIALALTACQKAAAEPDKPVVQAKPWPVPAQQLYQTYIRNGTDPVVARDMVNQMLASVEPTPLQKVEAARREGEREKVRSLACRSDPTLGYC